MLNLESLYEESMDWRFKAVPATADGLSLNQWLKQGPQLSQLETPVMTLDAEALAHNVSAMADWCAANGLAHAPHGKTTMAPALWDRQLDHGAWAITLANVAQARVAKTFGVPRIVIANEVLNAGSLRQLAQWADGTTSVLCFVDSVEAVQRMDDAIGNDGRLAVCVELGGIGGRAGARSVQAATEVATAVRSARGLRLVGGAGYEGAIAHGVSGDELEKVDEFLWGLRVLCESLDYETDEPIVTVGGSQYYDQVASVLGPLSSAGARVVLRAGSYITHDDGTYQQSFPAGRDRPGPRLRPALRAYATVLSKPEPELAILDAGRRDLPFDAGLPVVLDVAGANVVGLNDQHAYVHGDVSSLSVGDVVRLGISHPCTAFDKWSLLPVLDGEETVVDAVRTFF